MNRTQVKYTCMNRTQVKYKVMFTVNRLILFPGGRYACDRMLVGFTTIYAINAYHH